MHDFTTDGGHTAEVEVGDDYVIYDRENHEAWLQSATAVDRGLMR
jgi:hypothetical protein